MPDLYLSHILNVFSSSITAINHAQPETIPFKKALSDASLKAPLRDIELCYEVGTLPVDSLHANHYAVQIVCVFLLCLFIQSKTKNIQT